MPDIGEDAIFKFGTKAEYTALATKDPNTWYIITDTKEIYIGNDLYASGQSAIGPVLTAGTGSNSIKQPSAIGAEASASYAVSFHAGKAKGATSLATGSSTVDANTGYAAAFGKENLAKGNQSFATGYLTEACESNSFTTGVGTVSDQGNMLATGQFNTRNSGSLFAVGIGTSENNRKDAIVVKSSDDASSSGMGGSVAVYKFSCNNETVTGNSSVGGDLSVTGSVTAGNITGSAITGDSITLNNSGTPYFSVDTTNGIKLGTNSTAFSVDPYNGNTSLGDLSSGQISASSITSSGTIDAGTITASSGITSSGPISAASISSSGPISAPNQNLSIGTINEAHPYLSLHDDLVTFVFTLRNAGSLYIVDGASWVSADPPSYTILYTLCTPVPNINATNYVNTIVIPKSVIVSDKWAIVHIPESGHGITISMDAVDEDNTTWHPGTAITIVQWQLSGILGDNRYIRYYN